jgi:NADPH2:quinone reductase
MKAIVYERTGPADEVLGLVDMPAIEPGPGEVRLRVRASGVNPSDTKRRAGWMGLRMSHPRVIPHSDGAGVIEAVGEGIPKERLGERVWMWNAQGGERAFGTAAVFGDGPIGGQTLLVQGGAGAVGHLAIQLATIGGARVLSTVSSPEKAALATAAGAHATIDYRSEDVAARVLDLTDGEGVDRIIEVDLAANLETDTRAVRPNGRIVSFSSTSDPTPTVPYYPLAFKDVRVHFLQGYLLPPIVRRSALRELNVWLSVGQLEVLVGARYPLDRTAEAHAAMESGTITGNIVIDVTDE